MANASRQLLSLVVAAAIPLVLFGGWAAFVTADRERADARAAAHLTALRVAERVTAEIAKEVEIVEALGISTALDGSDLSAFYIEAQRLAGTRHLWETVWLSDPSGMQVLNLLRPLGAALALDADPDSLGEVLRTRQSFVGGVGPVGPISGKRLVALRAPVIREGTLRYVLTVGLHPGTISRILRSAGAPEGWIGAIIDAQGRIVARTRAEEIEAGNPAAADARQAIARASDGTYVGQTLEGIEVEVFYRSLPGTEGWTVHFGIPRQMLDAPVTRSITLLVAGAIFSVLLAAVLAALIARDLTQRRRVEAERAALALRISEERGDVAIDAANLGTWRWEAEAARIAGSPRACSLLGLPVHAGAQREREWRINAFLANLHPVDRAALEDALRRCLATGELLDLELRVINGGEGMRWVRATGRRIDDGARTIHGVFSDIDPQKRTEAERRELMRRLAGAQENEQRRIARELHDQVGQTVTGLSLGLKGLETRLEVQEVDPATRNHVRWLQRLVGEVGRDIHRVSSDVRPTALDDLGLQRALEAHAAEWSRRFGIRVDVQCIGSPERVPPEVETVVYRAVQEALTNVLKHANARQVSIVLEHRGRELRVVVEDDGRGFDPEAVGYRNGEVPLGLSGMRERLSLVDGDLRIDSEPGAGTTLFIRVPFTEWVARHA